MSEKVTDVLNEETFRNCLMAILSSCCKTKTKEEFEEEIKEVEKKYGEENTKKVATALLAVLKEKNQ